MVAEESQTTPSSTPFTEGQQTASWPAVSPWSSVWKQLKRSLGSLNPPLTPHIQQLLHRPSQWHCRWPLSPILCWYGYWMIHATTRLFLPFGNQITQHLTAFQCSPALVKHLAQCVSVPLHPAHWLLAHYGKNHNHAITFTLETMHLLN